MITKKFCPRSNSSASSSSGFSFRRRKKSLSNPAAPSTHEDAAPSSPPRLARRSVSPSELHYFSNSGGCNAALLPLELQYESNETLLELFNASLKSNEQHVGLLLDKVAYGIGVKYVEVALFTIPRHGYYEKEEYRDDRERSVVEARRVVKLLEGLVQSESAEEGELGISEQRETLHKLAVVAERSYDEVIGNGKKIIRRFDDWKGVETVCTSWKDYVLDGTSNLCSLLETLDYCGAGLGTVAEEEGSDAAVDAPRDSTDDDLETKELNQAEDAADLKESAQDAKQSIQGSIGTEKNTSLPENQLSIFSSSSREVAPYDEMNAKSMQMQNEATSYQPQRKDSCDSILTEQAHAENTYATTSDSNNSAAVNAQVQKQQTNTQNSYHSYTSDGFDREELALALSLSKQDCTTSQFPIKTLNHKNDISTQTKLYQRQFHSLVEKDKLHVRFLDTYQGRIPGSTNGCTVIAPLTCIQYFTTPECNPHSCPVWNAGVPDEHIHQVIDVHAPSVLRNVRSKLNLAPDSFIIPSDVHDHLFEVGLLSPSSFVGVCGGNILDDEHLMQLKQLLLLNHDDNLRKRLDGKKIASPMFFHGHVIALHVIRDADAVWIELIDSLPNPEAWVSPSSGQSRSASNHHASSYCEGREPEDELERQEQYVNESAENELPMNAVRVRCTDLEHFDVLLRHYALSKFSREERKFIDENQWEENNCHFDPRVFQAFIFSEAE